MKILFILENHYPKIGGVETLFKNLTDSLSNEGHTITVLTNKSFFDGLKFKESYQENLTIIRTPFVSRYFFTFLAWLPAFFYARKHDLIHTTSYNAGIPAYLAGFLARKKVIITFHEVWGKMWFTLPFFSQFSLKLHYWFEQLLLYIPFDRFIAVSNFTASQLELNGISQHKISMIYNGLDYDEFNSTKKREKPNATFRFLYFGRLGISKGLDILIQGAAQCKRDFELILILPKNPASFLETIKLLITKYKLESKTKIFHELDFESLKQNVADADTVIVPSYSEGFCFSAVETIALNTPIISSDQGALKEVVCGSHIKMESFTPDALTQAMERAMNDDFDHAPKKEFHLSTSIEQYKALYKEISK